MNKIIDSMWDEVSPDMKRQAADLISACIDAICYIEHGGSGYDQTEVLDELRTAVASHA
jgi:hypothetical protein